MDLIPLAALVVGVVGLSAAAVWTIVTRSEDKLRDEIRDTHAKNETAHARIVTRLEDGFRETNRDVKDGFREVNSNFHKLFLEVGEVKGRQMESAGRPEDERRPAGS